MKTRMTENEAKRFWAKVDVKNVNECWEWLAGLRGAGYGTFWSSRGNRFAHRVIYMHEVGMENPDNIVMHTCDNPKCVNPNHLIEGTQLDNVHDMVSKNRQGNSAAKLNEECVKVIKWMLREDGGASMIKKLASLHKVHTETIRQIKRNNTWSHIKI